MAFDVNALKRANAARWSAMKLDPDRIGAFDRAAGRLCAPDAKRRYVAVTERLRALGYVPVPWWAIAVISEREYGGPPRWDRQLSQGDPLDQVSTHDPAGRGPFLDHPGDTIGNDAWTRGCLDALIDCAPHAAKWTDWSPGGTFTILEEYNGIGYALHGVPSAYIWSGSDQYESGKYVADHEYRADVKDVQEGCAPLVKRMMVRDPSIEFGIVATPPAVQDEVNKDTKPDDPDTPLWIRALQHPFTKIGQL